MAEGNRLGPEPRINEYQIYKDSGRPVRIYSTPNGTAIGIIDNVSSEFVYLKPSMINQGTYNFDGSLKNYSVVEKELPTKIKINAVTQIEPLEEGYMERLVQNLNFNAYPPKIIITQNIK